MRFCTRSSFSTGHVAINISRILGITGRRISEQRSGKEEANEAPSGLSSLWVVIVASIGLALLAAGLNFDLVSSYTKGLFRILHDYDGSQFKLVF